MEQVRFLSRYVHDPSVHSTIFANRRLIDIGPAEWIPHQSNDDVDQGQAAIEALFHECHDNRAHFPASAGNFPSNLWLVKVL